jgi:hypothetical protein
MSGWGSLSLLIGLWRKSCSTIVDAMRQGAIILYRHLMAQGVDVNRCAFISLGTGKSGDLFRYFFRQANRIRDDAMVNMEEIGSLKRKGFSTLVFFG